MKTTTKKSGASVCIYGTSRIGSGYIASTADGRMFGDGTPRASRTATSALWLACDELRAAGVKGLVAVHIDAACGPMVALTDVSRPESFGRLDWKAAPVYVISEQAVRAAAGEEVR